MGKKIVFLLTVFSIFLVVVFFEFFIFNIQFSGPNAKIAFVAKEESWYSTFHIFSFTVNITNNGTDTVNNATVVIGLYHDWMNISWPVSMYTDEVQDYLFGGNILHFGAISVGGNEAQSVTFWVDDLYIYNGGGMAVPTNHATATLFLGNATLDKRTLQFNYSQGEEQTWVFP